ncbi:MAG TPA: iron ABC transporter permease, partial [Dehalococcoidia bacterium]|nr:iron ABC transporter permease [Dehalococcoidia bacterium]
ISVGSVYISPGTVWDALLGRSEGTSSVIVNDIRLPRVIVGAMVGASLAMSGAILQGITRNPLADPHIFGISAGAALVAVIFIVLLPSIANEQVQVAAGGTDLFTLNVVQPLALLGGLAGGGLAYLMAWRGGVSPVRLALAGIAVTSMLTAITSGILVTSAFSAQIGLRWLIGGLSQRNWNDVHLMAPYFIVGSLAILLLARQVNVIALGDELATSLGQRVERTRFVLAATAALLASAAVSIAGLIGFLGLIIPHFVRLLLGNDYRIIIPASAVFGAILLVLADTAARTIFDPQELPVGVLTAVLGGPVFILLVRSRA